MPDRNRPRNGGRPEFEVAWYTKELGKTLQRQMLEKQMALLSDSNSNARHGEDASPPAQDPPPPDITRAG